MITIKHRYTDTTLCEFDVETVKQAAEEAVLFRSAGGLGRGRLKLGIGVVLLLGLRLPDGSAAAHRDVDRLKGTRILGVL